MSVFRAYTTQCWEETRPRTKSAIKAEFFVRTQKEKHLHKLALDEKRSIWSSNGAVGPMPTASTIPRIVVDTTETVEVHPTKALELMTHIVNLSITKVRDLPENQKRSVVTGLPKKGAYLQDMKNLRPISVGPCIGRLIDKVMAIRLGKYLAVNGTLDSAQYAFLPHRNIHDPINIVRECFEQSLRSPDGSQGRACYAIFYDISKAHDTVEWTSITEALKRLNVDDNFIQFVHNSLVGTNLCMKTATKGRTTESVLMHRAIKQGDPLAPLLH